MLPLVVSAGPQVQHPAGKRRRSELAQTLLKQCRPPTQGCQKLQVKGWYGAHSNPDPQ